MKFKSVAELYDFLPKNERIIVDILRLFVVSVLPKDCKEKLSYNVPFFYRKKGVCIIWPASVPRGGIPEGVLFGFWQGNRLIDSHSYLVKGTNKKIYYRIFKSAEEIDFDELEKLLIETIQLKGV